MSEVRSAIDDRIRTWRQRFRELRKDTRDTPEGWIKCGLEQIYAQGAAEALDDLRFALFGETLPEDS